MEDPIIESTSTPEVTLEKQGTPVVETQAQSPKKQGFPMWIGVIILVILLFASIFIGYITSKRVQHIGEPVITQITPTITPIVNTGSNPIATTSAFLQLESSIASLSSQIAGFNPADPQVVPPVLDLPLGFSN